MRVDNCVAERRPHHNGLDGREPHRMQAAGVIGTRRSPVAVAHTASVEVDERSRCRSGAGPRTRSRFSWSGVPGVRSSSAWHSCEREAW